MTPEQRRLQMETNASVIAKVSFEIYKKTFEEKQKAQNEKRAHNARLRDYYGKDWKKHTNIH